MQWDCELQMSAARLLRLHGHVMGHPHAGQCFVHIMHSTALILHGINRDGIINGTIKHA